MIVVSMQPWRLKEAKIMLNPEKCALSCPSVKFIGQVVAEGGVRTDPDKIASVLEMPSPNNVGEVRRFLGLVTQQAKYLTNLVERTEPLRALLKKLCHWVWGEPQQKAYDAIKKDLTHTPVLAIYDVQKETILTADASSYGLGAVLSQKQPDGSVKPIVYASQSLSETQRRYTQIEKEALALTWGGGKAEKFRNFLIGKQFHLQLETDHKPLVPLLGQKGLNELPLHIQRFRMRLLHFNYTITHVPGKSLYIQKIKEEQDTDATCHQVKIYARSSWPPKAQLKGEVKLYAGLQQKMSISEGLLLRGMRIVIPQQ